LGGGKSPLNLPTLRYFFADRTGKYSCSLKERKATTQRANGKRAVASQVRAILRPDFLMFHGEQIPAQSLFRF
jgi:hypothetical protein